MEKIKKIATLALPYFASIFLPLISVVYLGNTVISIGKKDLIAEKQRGIQSAFDNFTQRTDAIETMAYMIARNEVVKSYVYLSMQDADTLFLESSEVKKLLNDINVNKDVKIIFLYDEYSNQIITCNAVLSNPLLYFRYSYRLANYTEEENIDRLRSNLQQYSYSPAVNALIGGEKKRVIEYLVPLPVERIGKKQIQLVLVMETEKVFDDLLSITEGGGEFYIYDRENVLIYSNGSNYEDKMDISEASGLTPIDSGKYGAVFHSSDGKWKLKIIVPELITANIGTPSSAFIWSIMILTVIGSSTLCIYWTFKNHRAIQEIIDERRRLSEKSDRYENSYKHELLDKLLRNVLINKEEADAFILKELPYFRRDKCVVICIRLMDSLYRSNVFGDLTVKDFLKKRLDEVLERKYEAFDISAKEMICILSWENGDSELMLKDMISRLYVELSYNFGIEMEITAGEPVHSLYDLSDSYRQAKAVIKYREATGKTLYLYSELEKVESYYYYPIDAEEKIRSYTLTGEKNKAKDIIQKIYEETMRGNGGILSEPVYRTLEEKLWNCVSVMAESYHINIKNIYQADKVAETKTQDERVHIICEAIDYISDRLKEKKQNVQWDKALKIHNYLVEHYCDNDLSLKKLSFEFGLNESYISSLFKNEYGENVAGFIEKQRIKKACEMLEDPDIKIGDIAETVGYSSDVSFRRAFKKVTGMTPGAYREK